MYTFLIVCHIIIAVAIVIAVLLQSGKGGGLGAGFGGGGANTLFGSSGGGNFFTKLTMGLAFAFFVTSLSISALGTKSLKTSIFDQNPVKSSDATAPSSAPIAANEAAKPAEKAVEAKSEEKPASAANKPTEKTEPKK